MCPVPICYEPVAKRRGDEDHACSTVPSNIALAAHQHVCSKATAELGALGLNEPAVAGGGALEGPTHPLKTTSKTAMQRRRSIVPPTEEVAPA